jgi:predicted O-methyltransferase YrrM
VADLFVPPGHFYSPLPDIAEAERRFACLDSNVAAVPGINVEDGMMIETWHKLSPVMRQAPFPEGKDRRFRYFYENNFFSYGDALVYFALLATLRPRRVVEIGSGYSSALLLDARAHLNLNTELTFIEPYPDVIKSLLMPGDEQSAMLIEGKVQDVPIDTFENLESGDILFIDSSHVAKTGSDVCREVFEIFPVLKPGVFVHIHDVFWPFEYPRDWVVGENRAWNELYLIHAFLMYNEQFSITFFNHYFMVRHEDIVSASGTLFRRNCGGSLWLTRNSKAGS